MKFLAQNITSFQLATRVATLSWKAQNVASRLHMVGFHRLLKWSSHWGELKSILMYNTKKHEKMCLSSKLKKCQIHLRRPTLPRNILSKNWKFMAVFVIKIGWSFFTFHVIMVIIWSCLRAWYSLIFYYCSPRSISNIPVLNSGCSHQAEIFGKKMVSYYGDRW